MCSEVATKVPLYFFDDYSIRKTYEERMLKVMKEF